MVYSRLCCFEMLSACAWHEPRKQINLRRQRIYRSHVDFVQGLFEFPLTSQSVNCKINDTEDPCETLASQEASVTPLVIRQLYGILGPAVDTLQAYAHATNLSHASASRSAQLNIQDSQYLNDIGKVLLRTTCCVKTSVLKDTVVTQLPRTPPLLYTNMRLCDAFSHLHEPGPVEVLTSGGGGGE
jgi:hypothetical protein